MLFFLNLQLNTPVRKKKGREKRKKKKRKEKRRKKNIYKFT